VQWKYEYEMWKHDQNNIAPLSAVFAANCRFKGNNFYRIKERFWKILRLYERKKKNIGKKNWSLFRRIEPTDADVFFIFEINNKTIIEFGFRQIFNSYSTNLSRIWADSLYDRLRVSGITVLLYIHKVWIHRLCFSVIFNIFLFCLCFFFALSADYFSKVYIFGYFL
jgi:hypothetical protein